VSEILAEIGQSVEERSVSKPRTTIMLNGIKKPRDGITLAFIPGATPGKWARRWFDRFPRSPLTLIPIDPQQVNAALESDQIDAAITTLPVDKNVYHALKLYTDNAVLVFPKTHIFAALDAEEAIPIQEIEAIKAAAEQDIPEDENDDRDEIFTPAEKGIDPKTAIEWVAAGMGLAIIPMSLARLHKRKDLTFRLIDGAEGTDMGLIWLKSKDGPLLQELAGVVRGRTPTSTRGVGQLEPLEMRSGDNNFNRKSGTRNKTVKKSGISRNPVITSSKKSRRR